MLHIKVVTALHAVVLEPTTEIYMSVPMVLFDQGVADTEHGFKAVFMYYFIYVTSWLYRVYNNLV